MSGPGAVTTGPLHWQRYFCRRCMKIRNVTSLTVISSDCSNWPCIGFIEPPQSVHSGGPSKMWCTSSRGRLGCAVGPWPVWGLRGFLGFGSAGSGPGSTIRTSGRSNPS